MKIFSDLMIAVVCTGISVLIPFIIIYNNLIKPAFLKKKINKTGKNGTGTITRIEDSGMTINDNPRINLFVNIRPEDGNPSFEAKIGVLVSRINPNVFQTGMQVPIKYDPVSKKAILSENTDNITGQSAYGNASDESNEFQGQNTNQTDQINIDDLKDRMETEDRMYSEIRTGGVPARAIVLTYTPLGMMINRDNPYVSLEIEVLPEDDKPFKAETKGVIMESSVHKYQPGKEIFVKYDPNDRTKVAIDHS
jgi:hypothetical protein